jgi:hypothetical protein
MVVLSERESLPNATFKNAKRGKLQNLVGEAIGVFNGQREGTSKQNFGNVEFVPAIAAIATRETIGQWVRELCSADLVIFDLTNFEPAVMFLIGIRAVVRRGVTILSIGGDDSLAAIEDLPFNIKDANVFYHGERDGDDSRKLPWERLLARIEDGISQIYLRSREYLDLPAYDAVRKLPEGEREKIPVTEGILVLAAFNDDYKGRNWKMLRKALDIHLKKRRTNKLAPAYGVVRSVDLDSPRLVSHAIYGFIRRAALSVVDWGRTGDRTYSLSLESA